MSEPSVIPCSSCDHESPSGLAAFEHWRDNHKHIPGEELGPGLHKVGENPWDYVYNPAVGQRVTSVDVDGRTHTGVVTDFQRNRATSEIKLTVQPEWLVNASKWLEGLGVLDESDG